MREAIWIAWENHLRNRSLTRRLGVELHVFLSERPRLVRYAICSCKSLLVIWRRRPTVVFAQNPSIILIYVLMLLKYLFRYAFVIDAHYVGVVGSSPLYQWLLDYCNRCADLVIVTNEAHCRHVELVGGRALVCEDPLPDMGKYARTVGEKSKDVLVIASFGADEPYAITFEAARVLHQEGYVFWVSGNFKKAGINSLDWPYVHFMGYVSATEFYSRLAESQIVVDLTGRENCLVCGAYEAMALEKPLVTSNTIALRGYFTGGTIFVDHEAQDVAAGVRLAYERKRQLQREIRDWKKQIANDNTRKIEAIRLLLNLPTSSGNYVQT